MTTWPSGSPHRPCSRTVESTAVVAGTVSIGTFCGPEGEIEFVITVKEFASRNAMQMRFYAQADKEINQRIAPFRAFGWGDSLLAALTECLRTIRQYPYEPG